ncbi:MAG: hypothetical protein L6R35_003551 [Caloplaca aegaea]|nr:MAG: hypothetical protein L6R35_003551 [Caloplaca aegaea]
MSLVQLDLRNQGPRPINTLRGIRPTTSNQSVGLPHGGQRQLDTVISVGENLHWRSSKPEADASAERQPKRRKLEPRSTSQQSPHILKESESEDVSITGVITKVRHIPAAPQTSQPVEKHSFNSQKSAEPTTENGRLTAGAPEHQSFEKSIRYSRPNHKKRRDAQKRRARGSSGTPRSSITSSYADPLESSLPEVPVNATAKTSHRGTANLQVLSHPHVADEEQSECGTVYRSRYFAMPDAVEPIHEAESAKSAADGGSVSAEMELRNSYRDTNGRRRSSLDQFSSDELVTAESNSRALSPIKTVFSQAPAQLSQQDSPNPTLPKGESFEVEQTLSNIRPSSFTHSVKHGAPPRSRPHSSDALGGKPSPRGIPIRAYYLQGRVHQGESLGLVYNDRTKCYDIHQGGQSLAKSNQQLEIRPAKLQRIIFTLEGTKMRFKSSKVGIADTILDIDLRHEKDAQQLIAILQETGSILVKGENKEKMDRMFDHRLVTQRKEMASGRHLPPKQPDDVVLAGVRIERADNKRDAEELRQDKSKRRRMVDGLGLDRQSGNNHQPRFRHPTAIASTTRHGKLDAQTQPITPDELHFTPLEDALNKYTLRSNRASTRSMPFDVTSQATEPEFQKYSRTGEIGKKWAKPLVYPKVGKKRTTVEWSDMERLDEGEFLNDNLVAFYLRYLEHQAEQSDPSLSRKVYVFNTFFYERLTDTKPRHKGINYDAVRKWTRGVDLFTYDFVVVPVNEAYHWYIAIICNLPALNRGLGGLEAHKGQDDASGIELDMEQTARDEMLFSPGPQKASYDAGEASKEHETAASFAEMSLDPNTSADQDALDDQLRDPLGESDDVLFQKEHESREADGTHKEVVDMEETSAQKQRRGKRKSGPSPRIFDPFKPTILTFDSLGTTHSTAIRMLKQYLHEEANDKRGQMEFDEKDLQGVTAKDIPQQSNYYDCGLYILGYMEKFFDEPRVFINKVMRKEWDVKSDWPKLDPSVMRANMRDLLKQLHKDQHKENLTTKRIKANSKSSNGPSPSPSTKWEPPSSDVNGKARLNKISPKIGPREDQQSLSLGTSIPSPAQTTEGKHYEPFHAGIGSLKERREERKSPPTTACSLASQEEYPRSFTVLDGQSQPANTILAPQDPDLPDSLAMSPRLPSTIPDSQAHVPDNPLVDGPPQISATPPPLKKPARRIDSFSSPLPASKGENKSPSLAPKQRKPASAEQREAKRKSGGYARAVIVKTDPKVIISID